MSSHAALRPGVRAKRLRRVRPELGEWERDEVLRIRHHRSAAEGAYPTHLVLTESSRYRFDDVGNSADHRGGTAVGGTQHLGRSLVAAQRSAERQDRVVGGTGPGRRV